MTDTTLVENDRDGCVLHVNILDTAMFRLNACACNLFQLGNLPSFVTPFFIAKIALHKLFPRSHGPHAKPSLPHYLLSVLTMAVEGHLQGGRANVLSNSSWTPCCQEEATSFVQVGFGPLRRRRPHRPKVCYEVKHLVMIRARALRKSSNIWGLLPDMLSYEKRLCLVLIAIEWRKLFRRSASTLPSCLTKLNQGRDFCFLCHSCGCNQSLTRWKHFFHAYVAHGSDLLCCVTQPASTAFQGLGRRP